MAEAETVGLLEHLGASGYLSPYSLVSPCGLSIWGSMGFLTAWRTRDKWTIYMAVQGSRASVLGNRVEAASEVIEHQKGVTAHPGSRGGDLEFISFFIKC